MLKKITNQSGNAAMILVITIVVTALVAAGLTYSWQKKQADDKVKSVEQEKTSYQAKADDLQKQLDDQQKALADLQEQQKAAEEAAKWQPYASLNYNLLFSYPKGWTLNDVLVPDKPKGFVGIGLTAASTVGDFDWTIVTYKTKDTSLDKIIASIGAQYTDREVAKEQLEINGLNATVATVTAPSQANWGVQVVVFEKNSKFYVVSGPAQDDTFVKFYKSIVIN